MDDVKAAIRGIMIYLNRPSTYRELLREYQKRCGEPMPHPGYRNAVQMLKDMPDVLEVSMGLNQTHVLKLVSTGHSGHIAKLVSQQKRERTREDERHEADQKYINQTMRFREPLAYDDAYSSSESESEPEPNPPPPPEPKRNGNFAERNMDLLDYIFL